MKALLLPIALLMSSAAFAQVGVNNTSPKATMDIMAKTTDGSKPEGLIVPRLTGAQLNGASSQYGAAQNGTIIYVTSADPSPAGKTVNVTAVGYYYFDGSIWQKVISSNSTGYDTTNDAWVNDNTNTMVKLGTQSDGSTARTVGTEFTIKDNGYVGIGTAAPSFPLTVASGNGQYPVGVAVAATTHATSRRAALGVGYWQILQDILGTGSFNFSIYNGTPSHMENVLNISDTSNYVGIGVQTPVSKLDVGGNVFLRNSATLGGTVNIGLGNSVGVRRWGLGMQAIESGSGNAGGDFRIWNYADNGNLISSTVPAFAITRATGNVGIGTASPTAKLEISSGTAGQSGLKLTNLTSASAASITSSKYLTVDNGGSVILSAPAPPNAADLALFGTKITNDRPTLTGGTGYHQTLYDQGENADPANAFDASTGDFTVPSAGFYYFCGSVQFDNTVYSSPPNFIQCGLRIVKRDASNNSSTYVVGQQFMNVSVVLTSLSANGVIYCNVGDKVSMLNSASVTTGTTYQIAARTFQGWKISN